MDEPTKKKIEEAMAKGNLKEIEELTERKGIDNKEMYKEYLSIACESGHLAAVKYFTKAMGADFNKDVGLPLLKQAIANNHLDIFTYLYEIEKDLVADEINTILISAVSKLYIFKYLTETVDVNAVNEGGDSLLFAAVENGALDAAKFLIDEKQFDTSVRNRNGETLLHACVKHSRLNILKYLIEIKQLTMYVKDNSGRNLLSTAVIVNSKLASSDKETDNDINYENDAPVTEKKENDAAVTEKRKNESFEVIEYLVKDLKVDVNERDNLGVTPLHHAAEYGNLECVKYLADNKADLLASDCDGITPLHSGAKHLNVIKYFIDDKNLDPNTRCKDNWTPLHIAAVNGVEDVYKYLEAKNADIDLKTVGGITIMHLVAGSDNLSILKDLVEEKKLKIDARDDEKWIPLHFAASNGRIDAVKYLLQKGSSINDVDENDNTALHHATCSENVELVQYLVEEAKADAFKYNNKGETPISRAVLMGEYDIAEYYIDKFGFNNNIRKDGLNHLEIAIDSNDLRTVKLIIEKGFKVKDDILKYADSLEPKRGNEILEYLHEILSNTQDENE